MRRRSWPIVLASLVPAVVLAAQPLQGRGFAILPPGAGWSLVGQRPDAITFGSHPGHGVHAPDTTPYTLTAGAQSILDPALARSLGAASQSGLQAVRAWLGRRLQAPRRDIAAFQVRPAELHGAHCAAYDAVQVDRIDPARIAPDHVEEEEFAQHGMVCAHPAIAGLVVQVFVNERFVRGAAPGRRVSEDEVRAFFDGVVWNP